MGLPVPHFLLLIAQKPLGNLSENGVIIFQPIREVTSPNTCFSKGCTCLDDNLKSTSAIHMKFGK